ncbi:MAG: hypothetical protein JXR77_11335, partial [Lentisphaeria bacterium]|nr:hypothetical protein [Lentisphaeria bacterium]
MMPSAPHRNPGETGLTRRRFLEGLTSASGALVAPMLVPASVRGNAATPPPSERIAVAVIGHGLMGRGHLRVCLGRPDLHVLAVCDPDRSRCQEARQR